MKKILLVALLGAGLVAFVGVDAVKSAMQSARAAVRDHLTSDVPLRTQLAEARRQVDAYAESVIRGEVAAENLAEMIQGVEREVRVLETRVVRGRDALVLLRRDLEAIPASTARTPGERDAHRQARLFRAQSELLDRRQQDLQRLRAEYDATVASIAEARTEQTRLTEEVHVLAAEVESLEARTAAARTRESVGDATVSSNGFAEAKERLARIRRTVREKNKLLHYYQYERAPVRPEGADASLAELVPADAREAIDEALAAWPGR